MLADDKSNLRITELIDVIKREVEFSAIVESSVVARKALQEHECGHIWCMYDGHIDIGCKEARSLRTIDASAFELASEAIIKRGLGVIMVGMVNAG